MEGLRIYPECAGDRLSGIFHRHENDETEITGYLVAGVRLFPKNERCGVPRTNSPMPEWATQAQQRNLIDGMPPFNGDDYIAGGRRAAQGDVPRFGRGDAAVYREGSSRLLDLVHTRSLGTKTGSPRSNATYGNAAIVTAIILPGRQVAHQQSAARG